MLTLVSALLAFLSGFLSVLSPCVLPLLPVVLASLLDRQRTGRWMLAIGLALSFALGGLFIGAVGWRIGVDGERLRTVGACGLLLWGMVLCLPVAGRYAGHLASPLASRAAGWLARVDPAGIWGPFLTGVLLGAVWAPCVGPTLGAAVLLAAEQRQLAAVLLVTLLFGAGAALPLVGLGGLSRRVMRARWARVEKWGRPLLGVALAGVAVAILSGWDLRLEAWLTDHGPLWLLTLGARF